MAKPRRRGGEDPEFEAWLREAERTLHPKLRGSAAFLAIAPPDDVAPDPKFCLELGMAICLDKPILVLVARGRRLDPRSRLFRVADEVVTDIDFETDDDARRVTDAVANLIPELREEPTDG